MKFLGNNITTLADITSVTAGTGLSGGGTSGAVTLNVDASQPGITTLAGVSAIGTASTPIVITSDAVTFSSVNADDPIVTIKNTSNNANEMARLQFVKDRGAAPAVGDNLAEIYFIGEDSGQNPQEYGRILCETDVVTDGQESGSIKLGVANHDGGNGYGLIMTGGSADNEVDVVIGLGTSSVTTIAGTLTMGSAAALDNSGQVVVASQPNITTLAGLTSLGAAGATTSIAAGDVTMYNAVNDGNPTISLGSATANRFEMLSTYNSGAQTLDSVSFNSYTTSGSTNDGRYFWRVDEVLLMALLDAGTTVYGNFTTAADGAAITSQNSTASSATEGGKLTLRCDDDNAMEINHRLGVVEFSGAEDDANNRQTGARIQAMCDAAWSASENGTRLEFYTMDGNAASELSLTLDSNLLATFAGGVTVTGTITGDVTGDVTGDLTGEADTVASIAGLAPNTATTQATQAAITTCANLASIGTITTGVWEGTDIEVAHGGTGASTLTDNAVLLGNGTGAVEASSHLSYYTPTSNQDYLRVGDGSTTASGIISDNAAPLIISVEGNAGTNAAGSDLTLIAGSGTGSGAGGDILFRSSAAGGSGTTARATAEIASLDNVGNLQIDGGLTTGSTAAITNAGLLSVGAQTGITAAVNLVTVGTIGAGVWNGAAIAQAYIAGDAINGDKIADDAVDSEHYTDGSIDTAHIADDQVTFAKALGVTPNVYGSTIKLIPSDFMANDDGGNTKFGVGYVESAGDLYGMRVANNDTELYAFVSIPQGMKATDVIIHAKQTLAVAVFVAQINATTMEALETGNCNTSIDITDTDSTATNFLVIQVTTTAATNSKVYGGLVTIAAQ